MTTEIAYCNRAMAFCAQPLTFFIGFSIDQCFIPLIIVERLKYCFHRQAEIFRCLFRRFTLAQHRREKVPDVHVAAFDPQDLPPLVRPWFEVFIRDFGCRAHR